MKKQEQLQKNQEQLQKNQEQLQKSKDQQQKQQQAEQQKLEELQQQIAVLKLNNGSLEQQDRKDLEKKINHYIKEIDRCIAQLGE